MTAQRRSESGQTTALSVSVIGGEELANKSIDNLTDLQTAAPSLTISDGGIFQIDGNFGYAAVINEMLLQSQTGRVELLPALPIAWRDGHVRGMRARGGYEFSFEWADHQLVGGRVKATRPGTLNLRYREREISVAMPAGAERPLLELLKP